MLDYCEAALSNRPYAVSWSTRKARPYAMAQCQIIQGSNSAKLKPMIRLVLAVGAWLQES